MAERIRRFTESDAFESVIVTLLVLNAGALAVEEVAGDGAWDLALWRFFVFSQVVFVVEIVLRLTGYAPRVQDFFREGWNAFDFAVVALSFVPAVGPLSYIARIIRVLRVLRVVSVLARRRKRAETEEAK